jgi:hypothetical protein
MSNDGDLFGVCFFGTVEKKNSMDFEGIYVFSQLDRPSAQGILALENLASE